MANVHGIEFSSNQSDLVKGLIRELLKDGNCAVYALPHMKPNGELRMACTPPAPGPRHQHGVFLRICHGKIAAIAIRPMHAKTGAEQISITASAINSYRFLPPSDGGGGWWRRRGRWNLCNCRA